MLGERAHRRDLVASLAVLGAVLVIALSALAYNGNWPKFARVLASAVAYACVVLLASRGGRRAYWQFAVAGAAAGMVSGLVRPELQPRLIVVGALLSAVLLGGSHWLALRSWRGVRAAVTD
jgi:hypothetical protein